MPKQLYPKLPKRSPQRAKEENRPYQVEYTDSKSELAPRREAYKTEIGARVGAWYNCRLIGFRDQAMLYEGDDLNAG